MRLTWHASKLLLKLVTSAASNAARRPAKHWRWLCHVEELSVHNRFDAEEHESKRAEKNGRSDRDGFLNHQSYAPIQSPKALQTSRHNAIHAGRRLIGGAWQSDQKSH